MILLRKVGTLFVLTFLAVGVGAWLPFFGSSTNRHPPLESHHRSYDLLRLLHVNESTPGVTSTAGPLPDEPAWRLRAFYDKTQLDNSTIRKIATTLHDQMSLYFVFKQHKKTLGSLLSVNLPGRVKPWLQVLSNLKTMRLNLVYHILEDDKPHQVSFKLPDKVGITWTQLLVTINQTDVRVWINCADYDKQKLAGHINLKIPKEGLIYFRQEPGLKNKLIGSVQVARILNYSTAGRVWSCHYDGQFGPNWKPPLIIG